MPTVIETFIELGKQQAELFEKDNIAFMNCMVTGEAMRVIMVDAYNALVSSKKIPKIESLPIEQKKTIWETAKEFANGRLSNEKCIELSRALFALEFYLK